MLKVISREPPVPIPLDVTCKKLSPAPFGPPSGTFEIVGAPPFVQFSVVPPWKLSTCGNVTAKPTAGIRKSSAAAMTDSACRRERLMCASSKEISIPLAPPHLCCSGSTIRPRYGRIKLRNHLVYLRLSFAAHLSDGVGGRW